MVVHGLKKYILENDNVRQKISLQAFAKDLLDSVLTTPQLLCDFTSTLEWHLSDLDYLLMKQCKLSPHSLLSGGDLHLYAHKMLSFCHALDKVGVQPVFIVNCPPNSHSSDVDVWFEKFRNQNVQELTEASTILQICDGVLGLSEAKWKLSDFAALHVETILKSLGTKFLYCTSGMQEVIEYCRNHREVFGILSSDTEVVVPKGACLFLPELFHIGHTDDGGLDIGCEFVTSSALTSSLQIDEAQLVDLAVLCGNSYTELLNESLDICSKLNLPDLKVTTVAQWLHSNNKLVECEEIKRMLDQHPCYREAVLSSYRRYNCQTSFSSTKKPKVQKEPAGSISEYVCSCVREGTVSRQLLPIVHGCYWRPVITELGSIGSTCFIDLTFTLRKSLCALLGVKVIREYGRTSKSRCASTTNILSNDSLTCNLEELLSLRQRPRNERLSLLFHLGVSNKEPEKFIDLMSSKALIDSDIGDKDHAAALLMCSALLFMLNSNSHLSPSSEITICEFEALLLTCLSSLAGVPSCCINDRPTSRAITVSSWFTHILQQLYLIGSILNLTDDLPLPGDIYSPLSFLAFHAASFLSMQEDDSETEEEDKYELNSTCGLQLSAVVKVFNNAINLMPVLALRAEILNSEEEPDLKCLVSLFAKSLEAIKLEKESLFPEHVIEYINTSVDPSGTWNAKGYSNQGSSLIRFKVMETKCQEPPAGISVSGNMDSMKNEPEVDCIDDHPVVLDEDDFHSCSDFSRTDCEELSSIQEHHVSEEDIYFTVSILEHMDKGLLAPEEEEMKGDENLFQSVLDVSDNALHPVDLSPPSKNSSCNKTLDLSSNTVTEESGDVSHDDNEVYLNLEDNSDSIKDKFHVDQWFPQKKRKSTRRVTGEKKLPVMAHKEKIVELINNHSVIIIEGETGCGKSTKVPQFIFDQSLEHTPSPSCKILVTQPRRVAAMKLAERVASERHEHVGMTVGFSIRGESRCSADTAITYCTIGYLLQTLVHHPSAISQYTHIILDEIHERSTDADFALLVLRKLAVEVSGFKIILMSATIQGDLLVSYFEQTISMTEVASPYFVGSKRYNIDAYFIDELDALVQKRSSHWHPSQIKAAATLKTLVGAMPKEDLKAAMSRKAAVTKQSMTVCTEVIVSQAELGESILVFLPGIAEIGLYQDILLEELELRGIVDNFSIFILHSQVPFEDQKGVFNSPPRNKVHVILATNIAESSITLPNLRLVINFGIYRHLCYDSKRKLSCLVKSWCSRSSCAQRLGRAGRVFEGIGVHLFTKRFYEVILPEFNPPDMCTASLTKLVLEAKQIGVKLGVPSPTELLMLALDPPSLDQMDSALQDLADLGAIVSEPGKEVIETAEITLLGKFSLSLPVDIVLSRLVLYGIFFGIPSDAIVLAAEMSLTQDVFSLPSRCLIKEDKQYYSLLLQSIETRFEYDRGQFSDGLIVCRMFQDWIQYRNENSRCEKPLNKRVTLRNFCRNHAVRGTRLLQLEATVAQIASRVLSLIPKGSEIYRDISFLSMITRYIGAKSKVDFFEEIHVNFCINPLLLKSLLTAAFSHQIVVGVPEVDSHFTNVHKTARAELAYMEQAGIDPTQSIVMRNMDYKNHSATHAEVYELLSQLLPGVPCVVSTLSDTFCIQLTPQSYPKACHPPYLVLPPSKAVCSVSSSSKFEMFVGEVSVVSQKLSRELYIIWQFGERRSMWTVEGIRASFTRPEHPLSLSWQNLSSKGEHVFITSFRNPSAFVCDFSSCSHPFLAVPTLMRGSERRCLIFARKLTILPSLKDSAAALLLVIAFQSLNSNFELLVDHMEKKVVGFKVNGQEIVFGDYQLITVEDIVRINALRKAISIALRSHASSPGVLSVDSMANIPPLLDCVLNRTPIQGLSNLPSPPQTASVTPDLHVPSWEKQFFPHCDKNSYSDDSEFEDNDSNQEDFRDSEAILNGNINLNSFSFHPSVSCSLLKTVSFSEDIFDNLLDIKKGPVSNVEPIVKGLTEKEFERSKQVAVESEKLISNAFRLSPLAKPFYPFSRPEDISSEHKSMPKSVKKGRHFTRFRDIGKTSRFPTSAHVASSAVEQNDIDNDINCRPPKSIHNSSLLSNTSADVSSVITSEKPAATAGNVVYHYPTLSQSQSFPSHNIAYPVPMSQSQIDFRARMVGSHNPRMFGISYPLMPLATTNPVNPQNWFNFVLNRAMTGSELKFYSQEQAEAYYKQFSEKFSEELCTMLMSQWRQQASSTTQAGVEQVQYKDKDERKCKSSEDNDSSSKCIFNAPNASEKGASVCTSNQNVSQLSSLQLHDSLKDFDHVNNHDSIPSKKTQTSEVLPSDLSSDLKDVSMLSLKSSATETQKFNLSQLSPESCALNLPQRYSPSLFSQCEGFPQEITDLEEAFENKGKDVGVLHEPGSVSLPEAPIESLQSSPDETFPATVPLPPSLESSQISQDHTLVTVPATDPLPSSLEFLQEFLSGRLPDPTTLPLPPSLRSSRSSSDEPPGTATVVPPPDFITTESSESHSHNSESESNFDKMVKFPSLDPCVSLLELAHSDTRLPNSNLSMLSVSLPQNATPPFLSNPLSPRVREPFLPSTTMDSCQTLSPNVNWTVPPNGPLPLSQVNCSFDMPCAVVSPPGVAHPVIHGYSTSPYNQQSVVQALHPVTPQSDLPVSKLGLLPLLSSDIQTKPLSPPGLQQTQCLSPLSPPNTQTQLFSPQSMLSSHGGMPPLPVPQFPQWSYLHSQAVQPSSLHAQHISQPGFHGSEHKPRQPTSSRYPHPVYVQPVTPLVSHSKYKSPASRQFQQSGLRPHIVPTQRYTRPQGFLNPPIRGSLTQRPVPRRKTTPCPSLPISYTSRYNQPTWRQGALRSIPTSQQSTMPPFDPKQSNCDKKAGVMSRCGNSVDQKLKIDKPQQFCSVPRSLAYLQDESQSVCASQDVKRIGKRGIGEMSLQRSLHKDNGIDDDELLGYFIYMLRLLGGQAELNQLCGFYYRQFLERYSISGAGVVLDPRFFTTLNRDVFKVCGPPGMFHVFLVDAGRENIETLHKKENTFKLEKETNCSTWSQQPLKDKTKITKETILPSTQVGIKGECSRYCEKITNRDGSPLTQDISDPKYVSDCADIGFTSQNQDAEIFFKGSEMSKSKNVVVKESPRSEQELEDVSLSSDVVSQETKRIEMQQFPKSEQKPEKICLRYDFVSVRKDKQANEFPQSKHESEEFPNELDIVLESKENKAKKVSLSDDRYPPSSNIDQVPLFNEKNPPTEVSVKLSKSVMPTALNELSKKFNAVHAESVNDHSSSEVKNIHSSNESNVHVEEEYLPDEEIKIATVGEVDHLAESQMNMVGKEAATTLETDKVMATASTVENMVTSESYVTSASSKPEILSSSSLDHKDDFEVKGYMKTRTIRCNNTASAFSTFSQSSNPNSSLPTPISFDEDCWIESNPPCFTSEQSTLSDSLVEDNVPVSVTTQVASSCTSTQINRPSSRGAKKTYSKWQPKPRAAKERGTLVYSQDSSGWEALDLPTEENSFKGSLISLQVEEDKCQLQMKHKKRDEVPPTDSRRVSEEVAVGSIPHFLSYTEEILSGRDSIPFTVHCRNYRRKFRLSHRKYWYDVSDLISDASTFTVEKQNKVDVIVNKGCCSVAVEDHPVRSEATKSGEKEKKKVNKCDSPPRQISQRCGYRGDRKGRKYSRGWV